MNKYLALLILVSIGCTSQKTKEAIPEISNSVQKYSIPHCKISSETLSEIEENLMFDVPKIFFN